jgi:hypothetical protein
MKFISGLLPSALFLCSIASSMALADATTKGKVVSVEIFEGTSTAVVEVKLDPQVVLNAACSGNKVMFDYQAGKASELYYSLLLTAQSTGSEVSLAYDVAAPLCTLTRATVYE